eukprot:scaffold647404_cov22-Prasinocladus_malaysianus.AAC.1
MHAAWHHQSLDKKLCNAGDNRVTNHAHPPSAGADGQSTHALESHSEALRYMFEHCPSNNKILQITSTQRILSFRFSCDFH